MAKVLRCGCSHSYQDEKYGEGMRVHNQVNKASKGDEKFRCTICGKERGA